MKKIINIFRERNKIFLAQTALHLEGIHLDYVNTKELLETDTIDAFGIDDEDAIVMHNVVNALNFLESINFSNLSIDIQYYITLNSILADQQALYTGFLRNQPVSIGCIPEPIPVYQEEMIQEKIDILNAVDENTFRNIVPKIFCELSLMQPFFDGNKRATNFLCNSVLLKKDIGLFIIDKNNIDKFNSYLYQYYTKQNTDIFEYIGSELIFTRNELVNDEIQIESEENSEDITPRK